MYKKSTCCCWSEVQNLFQETILCFSIFLLCIINHHSWNYATVHAMHIIFATKAEYYFFPQHPECQKMTGGTPDVRSDKFNIIEFWHLTSNQCNGLVDQWTNDQWTNEPMGQWTNGPTDQWTNRPTDQQTNGPTDQRTNGPTDQRTNRPMDQRTNGPTDQQTNGPTDQRTNGSMDQWTNGPIEHWNIGK